VLPPSDTQSSQDKIDTRSGCSIQTLGVRRARLCYSDSIRAFSVDALGAVTRRNPGIHRTRLALSTSAQLPLATSMSHTMYLCTWLSRPVCRTMNDVLVLLIQPPSSPLLIIAFPRSLLSSRPIPQASAPGLHLASRQFGLLRACVIHRDGSCGSAPQAIHCVVYRIPLLPMCLFQGISLRRPTRSVPLKYGISVRV
jgi:hypothetical protein